MSSKDMKDSNRISIFAILKFFQISIFPNKYILSELPIALCNSAIIT